MGLLHDRMVMLPVKNERIGRARKLPFFGFFRSIGNDSGIRNDGGIPGILAGLDTDHTSSNVVINYCWYTYHTTWSRSAMKVTS